MALGGILTCEAKGEDVAFQVKADAYTTIKQKQHLMKLVMSLGGPFEEVSAGFKTGARADYNDYKDVAALIEFMMADFYEGQFCDILKVIIFYLIIFQPKNPMLRPLHCYRLSEKFCQKTVLA